MSDVIPVDPDRRAEIPLDVLNAAVDLCRDLALTPTPASVRPIARALLAERHAAEARMSSLLRDLTNAEDSAAKE